MTESTDTVECPFCCEQVSAKAKKCRHCGETLDLAMRKAEEAMRASEKRGDVFMNAGGAAVASPAFQLRPFPHIVHLLVTIFTAGLWFPFWILMYLVRNKNVYI